MIRVNIHEAKTHLSATWSEWAEGESVVICKRNIPVAELRPIVQPEKELRPIGLDKGKFEVGPEFFEPLPDDILKGFYGEDYAGDDE